MSDTPFVAFSNDELNSQKVLHSGEVVVCPQCGEKHTIKPGKNENGYPTETLLFYNCGEKSYLAAIAGRSVMDMFCTQKK